MIGVKNNWTQETTTFRLRIHVCKMPRKGNFTQTESRLIAAWVWELGFTVIDMEILLGEWVGRVIFKNPFSPPEEQDAEERKNGQGKKVAPVPVSAMKKQEAKKLVSLQFENVGIGRDIQPKETSQASSNGSATSSCHGKGLPSAACL